MYLHLANSPRALYLVTSSQDERSGRPSRVLVFRADERNPSQAIVEFLPKDEVDLSNTIRLTNGTVKGCLGLIAVENDIFLALVTNAIEVGNTRPSAASPENVARIQDVSFYSLTSSIWDDLSIGSDSLGNDTLDPALRESYTPQPYEHPCAPLTKILSSGTFYYAINSQWDLSSRLSRRVTGNKKVNNDLGSFDERFVWNEYIVRSLLDFRERMDQHEREDLDQCHFIILAIQGYVGVFTTSLPAPPTDGSPTIATLSLISRLSWKRAGTRFNTRGVDDDGNCANFVETETIFSTDQHSISYAQVRGSVPLFWEQQGIQTFGQRIQITRPHASQPAFERHFSHLMEEYGAAHAINLLGSKENEAILTNAYDRHLQVARSGIGDTLNITHFDFHNQVRIGGHDSVLRELRRMEIITDQVDKFGFTTCDARTDDLVTDQRGIFRTNCLDCLDRTNFVQDILSRMSLEQYLLLVHREWIHFHSLWTHHRELWAENGDALSRIYAGTGALNTSFTRSGKRTLAGVLSDATKSVSRAYINNFQDKGKQIAIDILFDDPDRDERALYAQYWQHKLADKDVEFPDSLVNEIAAATSKFSFAYLKEAFVSSLVILAGIEDDEKPSFKAVIMDQIEKLRKQLGKTSINRHVVGRPLPAVLSHSAAVDPADSGRDYRQALHSLIGSDSQQAHGRRTFTNLASPMPSAYGNGDPHTTRHQEAERRFRFLFDQMNLQNGTTDQRFLY
ncbi:Inositol-1,4,5-trisphosphate 5-phosphatase 1 [Marasmius sp. AFHP31]|nr:Inositol-1,4,5-trisphosphate 5-phosphatase 1 [Marasmius sp. AFHP31]